MCNFFQTNYSETIPEMSKFIGVAPLIVDPSSCNSSTKQNKLNLKSPLFNAILFKSIMEFKNQMWDVYVALHILSKYQGSISNAKD